MLIENLLGLLAFEETLMFTSLDIALNSFRTNDGISEEALVEISEECLAKAFTCDRLPKKTE